MACTIRLKVQCHDVSFHKIERSKTYWEMLRKKTLGEIRNTAKALNRPVRTVLSFSARTNNNYKLAYKIALGFFVPTQRAMSYLFRYSGTARFKELIYPHYYDKVKIIVVVVDKVRIRKPLRIAG